MSEVVVHVEGGAKQEAERSPGGRTRTCVGCGLRIHLLEGGAEAADLVRLVLGPDGEMAVDAPGLRAGAFGRGAHVHARPACLDRAARGGIARSTKGRAKAMGADALARAIQEAMDRRIEGLFTTAVRSRQVAIGAQAVAEHCRRGTAELVVVARDAAAAAEVSGNEWARNAIAAGRAVAWGDARRLGQIVGRDGEDGAGVTVVALSSRTIARALQQAVQIADACAGAANRPPAPPRRGGGRGRAGPRSEGASRRGRDGGGDAGGSPQRRLSGVRSNVERGA